MINVLQFQPDKVSELQLMGSAIKSVHSNKILGVHVSDDLTWNTHIDYTCSRRQINAYMSCAFLKKSGLPVDELVRIFYALIKSVLKYASPLWVALPEYLDNLSRSVGRRHAANFTLSPPLCITLT